MRNAARRWLLACSMAVPGQIPAMPPRDAPPPQTGTAVIKGLVVDATTGAAVPRARVRVQGRGSLVPPVITDQSGAFAFTQLPAGSYSVTAERVGYLAGRYPDVGRTVRTMVGGALTVRDGDTIDTVKIMLSRGAVIAGRVLDAFGDPIENGEIKTLRVPSSGRLTSAVSRANGQTNDLGDFRIPRLEAGTYILLVTPRARSDDGTAAQASPTYYPGVASLEQAQPIALRRGDAVTGLVMTVVDQPAALVSGSVIDASGQRMTRNVAVLARSNARGMTRASETGLRPDGTFRFTLPPGDYEIEARSTTQGPANTRVERVGLQRISVAGGAISDLLVVLRDAAVVTGRLVFEGSSPLPSNRTAMRVDFGSGGGEGCRSSGRSEIAENWTFTVRGLVGTCRVRVSTGDRTWLLKAVRSGLVDLTDRPVTLEPGQVVRDVQVVLTDRRTEMALQVTDERGAPTTEYVAIVFPIDAARWSDPDSRYLRTHVPRPAPPSTGVQAAAQPGMARELVQAQGPASISGLPSGEYYVIAVDDVEAEYVRDPAFLKQLAPHATRISLAEGTPMHVPLRRIPVRSGQQR